MREYSKISPTFWIGETGKQIRDLVRGGANPGLWTVANYLITGPHSHMLGIYYLPITYIAHDTGLTLEGASEGLRRLSDAGFCRYDPKTEMVWVVEMARFQVGQLQPGDNRCKDCQKAFDSLHHKCSFLSDFYVKYKDVLRLTPRKGLGG